jgi:hypothetical protein
MQRILKKTPPHRTSILLLYNFDDEDDQLESASQTRSDLVKPAQASSSSDGSGLSSFWSTLVNSSGSYSGSDGSGSGQLIEGDGLGGQRRKVDDLVVDLFPSPNNGHIFIGFSTQQTTGTGFHLAAQVRIPRPSCASISLD